MCIRQRYAPDSATVSAIRGSPRSAVTSLTSSAPRSTARRATSALLVSIDSGAPCSPSSTGTTRRSSSASETPSDPGRVDSPPMSTIAAPSSSIRRPAATAAAGWKCTPPSENESGVTLTTPITDGRAKRSSIGARIVSSVPWYGRRGRCGPSPHTMGDLATRRSPVAQPSATLLFSDRPALYAFFACVSPGAQRAAVSLEAARTAPIEGIHAAIVDVALEPAIGIAICAELRRRQDDLPIAAVVCCPHAVNEWTLRGLLSSGVSAVLDLQTSADEAARLLGSVGRGAPGLPLQLAEGGRGQLP